MHEAPQTDLTDWPEGARLCGNSAATHGGDTRYVCFIGFLTTLLNAYTHTHGLSIAALVKRFLKGVPPDTEIRGHGLGDHAAAERGAAKQEAKPT